MKKKPISIITFVTEINKNKMFLAIFDSCDKKHDWNYSDDDQKKLNFKYDIRKRWKYQSIQDTTGKINISHQLIHTSLHVGNCLV